MSTFSPSFRHSMSQRSTVNRRAAMEELNLLLGGTELYFDLWNGPLQYANIPLETAILQQEPHQHQVLMFPHLHNLHLPQEDITKSAWTILLFLLTPPYFSPNKPPPTRTTQQPLRWLWPTEAATPERWKAEASLFGWWGSIGLAHMFPTF